MLLSVRYSHAIHQLTTWVSPWSLLFPHVHLGLLLSLTRLGDTGLEVLHEAHHILHLGFIMAADHKKNHGCSLQRHIDASWGGTQNILDQQPYLITNEPLVLLHKCITMNSISRSSCNAFLARRSHIQLVCQPGYQHCDETTSRSPLILPLKIPSICCSSLSYFHIFPAWPALLPNTCELLAPQSEHHDVVFNVHGGFNPFEK